MHKRFPPRNGDFVRLVVGFHFLCFKPKCVRISFSIIILRGRERKFYFIFLEWRKLIKECNEFHLRISYSIIYYSQLVFFINVIAD